MNRYLKQSTASQTRAIGPFVDDTDFKTLETGLTIANTDVKLMANGGASANKNSGGGTHLVNADYAFTFDATDSATVGELKVSISVAGALPQTVVFWVLEEVAYDAIFGANAALAMGSVIGAVGSLTGHTNQTGDSFARLGAPSGASVSADLLVIDNFVDELETRLSAVRAGYLDNINGHTAQTGDNFARLGAPAGASHAADLLVIDNLVDDLEGRLSAARAGYLDNLNIGENVAGTSEVTSIQNNTRAVRVVPTVFERPDSGSTVYRLEILLYDDLGNMEAPDSAPTIGVVNEGGTSRDVNLDATTMTLVSTGRYRSTYTIASSHALEQLIVAMVVTEGGNARTYGNTGLVVDTTAVDFTASDRTTLGQNATDLATLLARLTSGRATAMDELLAANLPTDIDSLLARLTAGRATALDNLDATISSRSSHAAVDVWDVLESALLTASSIGLKVKTNLDALISSRSSHTANDVTVDMDASSSDLNTIITNIGNLNNLSLVQLASELSDALTVDVVAELGVGAPSAAAPMATMVARLYQMAIMEAVNDRIAGETQYKNSSGTVIAEATTADASNVFTKGRMIAPT